MAKIEIIPDCGNAPRKLFLADLNTAFAKGDIKFVTKNIPDTVSWEIVGQTKIDGKENYLSEIKKRTNWKVKKLTIDTIITHGPDASVGGKIVTSDNSQFTFCDIYKFKGAGGTIINSITTFII